MSGGAYVLHSHSMGGVDRWGPFSLLPPILFPFSLPCLGLRFGLSLSEERNWSLPKSAKISDGWRLPCTD